MIKNSNFMKLDSIDRKILNELQQFGRKSASHIAEKIKVSVPTITERIKKLQELALLLGSKQFSIQLKWIDVAAIITIISGSSQYYKEEP